MLSGVSNNPIEYLQVAGKAYDKLLPMLRHACCSDEGLASGEGVKLEKETKEDLNIQRGGQTSRATRGSRYVDCIVGMHA